MFDRAALKDRAKDAIRGRLLAVFGVLFIVGIVAGLPSIINSIINSTSNTAYSPSSGMSTAGSLISLVGTILLTIPLTTQLCLYSTQIFRGESPAMGDAFNAFNHLGAYISTSLLAGIIIFLYEIPFLIAFVVGFLYLFDFNLSNMLLAQPVINASISAGMIFLFMLLLIVLLIPAIIKSYSYSQISYLVAEYPHLRAGKILKMSTRMMKGYRFKYWVLMLSFIGWELLCVLIIPLIYVLPYTSVTLGGFYDWRLKSALEEGVITHEELGIDMDYNESDRPNYDQD